MEWLECWGVDGLKVTNRAELAYQFDNKDEAYGVQACLNAVASPYGPFKVINSRQVEQMIERLKAELNNAKKD